MVASRPLLMPTMAAVSPGRLVSTPSKNTPKRAIQHGSNGKACFKHSPPVAGSKPDGKQQNAPAEGRHSRRLQISGFPASGSEHSEKIHSVVEAKELRAALRFDMAAARIAAIISPAKSGGKCSQINSG